MDATVDETEGPMHRGGYGRELIENALPYTFKAKSTRTLGKDRLNCTVVIPIEA